MKSQCSICSSVLESDESAILTMGGFASPRYLCEDCSADIDASLTERDADAAFSAIDRVSKKMTVANVDDKAVLKTVKELMTEAAERAEKIKNGEYDFSEEDGVNEPGEGEDEVPEELRETEEDKERDRREAEINKKLDKITNWVCFVLVAGAAAFLVYKIIETYFL